MATTSLNPVEIQQKLKEAESLFRALETRSLVTDSVQLVRVTEAYQQLASLYGYLDTFYPTATETREASRLVAYGRRLVFARRLDWTQNKRPGFFARVHLGAKRIMPLIGISGSLMIIGALLAWLMIEIQPALRWQFVPEDIAHALEEGRLWTENIQGSSSSASAQIMTNNIKVALMSFVLGITAGIGTVLVLLTNGIMLGGMFVALGPYGMGPRLLEFILAHGFLELSVIAVAGGCGLALADAMIHPGFLSRREAMQIRSRSMTELLLFCAAALVIAGVVEGFISPYAQIPVPWKLGLGTGLASIFWIVLLKGPLEGRAKN